jgi:hypothetical protein
LTSKRLSPNRVEEEECPQHKANKDSALVVRKKCKFKIKINYFLGVDQATWVSP